MNILSYQDMNISVFKCTSDPIHVVSIARARTMKQHIWDIGMMIPEDFEFILNAEHTSILEHVSFTFNIQNVSRSFLAQITRHRMGSFTSSSQHYQNYSDYPLVFSKSLNAQQKSCTQKICEDVYKVYDLLISQGVPKEEARQILPNAAAVNLMWTVNARSLVNFLRLRLCHRNVEEMRLFAERVYALCCTYFLELFQFVGPQCYMDGKCKQGKMSCGKKWEPK